MSGTPEGGAQAAATNKRIYGEDFYKKIGAEGGKAKVPKGFALNRERARAAGARGGRKSKVAPGSPVTSKDTPIW